MVLPLVGMAALSACGGDDSEPARVSTCAWQCDLSGEPDGCVCGRLFYTDTDECGSYFLASDAGALAGQCGSHTCCVRSATVNGTANNGRAAQSELCQCTSIPASQCQDAAQGLDYPSTVVASCPE